VTRIQSDRMDQGAKRHRVSLGLSVLNLMTSTGTAMFIWIRFGASLSNHPLAQAGLFFTGGLLLVDLAWLSLIVPRSSTGRAGSNGLQRLSIRQALVRPQSLIAWLIFHSAAIPLLILGPQSGSLQVPHYLAFLFAVLVMGLLPVGLIVWLDVYLAKKLQG